MLERNQGYWNAGSLAIDLVSALPFDSYFRISTDLALADQAYRFDGMGCWYLLPNPRFKPLDEPWVRQAMAHAVDREAIIRDVLRGSAVPAYTQNSPHTPFYNPNHYDEYTRFDTELARSLLQGTPYEGGQNWPRITMSMRNNESDVHKAPMARLVSDFRTHLGMSFDMEIGDPVAIHKAMRQGEKRLMWLRWYQDFPDAHNTNYECFFSGIPSGTRRSWWEHRDYDAAVLEAMGQPNQARRQQLYQAADEILVREAGAMFLYYPTGLGLAKPWVRGLPAERDGLVVPDWNIFCRMVDQMWIEE